MRGPMPRPKSSPERFAEDSRAIASNRGGARDIMSVRISCLIAVLLLAAAPSATHAAPSDFAGLVDIGGGRKMYLECRGSGSPPVLLVSGKCNGAALWRYAIDPS